MRKRKKRKEQRERGKEKEKLGDNTCQIFVDGIDYVCEKVVKVCVQLDPARESLQPRHEVVRGLARALRAREHKRIHSLRKV